MPAIPFDGNIDLQNASKIVNSPNPTSPQDVATKAYADSIAQGIIWKQAVRAASVGSNVSTSAPGGTLDGYTLVAGDRILLKDQTTGSQNGIWTWNGAAAALTRPADYAAGASENNGVSVYVDNGTVNGGDIFTLITTGSITVDTTVTAWSQTNGVGQMIAGAGLAKSGNTISIENSGVLGVAHGGTGAASAAAARTALAATGKFATTVGDGAATTFTVTHNLGTTDVTVQVWDMATGNYEIVGIAVVNSNSVSVGAFATAPAAAGGSLPGGTGKRVVVTG